MSTIKSSTEHLTLNADGSGKDIKFQANGVEKASISSTGAFTSTSIDATKLSGTVPNFTSTGIDDNSNALAMTIDSSERVGVGTATPAYRLDTQTLGHNSTGELLVTAGNNANDNYTQAILLRLRATSINANQPSHSANSAVGEISFLHHNLSGSASAGSITFSTNPSNNINGSLAERMRIDSSGKLLWNGGYSSTGATRGVTFNGTSTAPDIRSSASATTTLNHYVFYNGEQKFADTRRTGQEVGRDHYEH